MKRFAKYIRSLVQCVKQSASAQSIANIFMTPSAVQFQPGGKLTALRAQLFLVEFLERTFAWIDSAMFRFPTEVQTPSLIDHRVNSVCRDEAERRRYRFAIYFRKALVFDRLASWQDARFRLLIPEAFVAKFCRIERPLIGKRPSVERATRDSQLKYLASLVDKFPGLEVRFVGQPDANPLLYSYYLAEVDGVSSGLDLSRVSFDRNLRGKIIDTRRSGDGGEGTASAAHTSQFERRKKDFDQLWAQGRPVSGGELRRLARNIRSER